MAVAALVAWVATAGGGLVMFGIWLSHHGPAQHRDGQSRFPPKLIMSHLGLAATGLAVWVVSVVTDLHALRWVSIAVLPLVALLGLAMFIKWLGGRGADGGRTEVARPAEQYFPLPVVALHGLLAVVTVILAVVAALRIGAS
jgi:hypothetical protein